MTADLLAMLADLANAGQTMVVVTFAMNLTHSAADTVQAFESGQVLESAPPQQIFETPLQSDTADSLRECGRS